LLTQGRSVRTYLVTVVEGILILGSFSYLGAYLSHQFGLDNLAIGVVMTAFGVAAIIAGRVTGRVAGRIGRRQTLILGLLLAVIGDGAIFALGENLAIAAVAILLLGAGFMFAHSTLLTLATEFAASARGTAMSLVAFCFMGGGAAGTALGGRVLEATSFGSFFGLWAALLLGLTVVAFVAVSDTLPSPVIECAPSVARAPEG
jgi:predicted MFS family arabinose efflux permease